MKRIGILGGGQLARMMIYESKKLGPHFTVLDPSNDAPAASLADIFIQGGLYDREKITQVVESCDVTTYDIEHIDTETLIDLENRGNLIAPSPGILQIIQDKYIQKETLAKGGLPVGTYYKIAGPNEIDLTTIPFPFVQKARTGGYDGRGVAVIKNNEDLKGALPVPSIIEKFVPFTKELAVMAARTSDGEIKTYPPVEMIFDPVTNICSEVIAPADISPHVAKKAAEIAGAAVELLQGRGIFGVELFLTSDDEILINELAPRPHNSGHYTIEACAVSQFEQHIRAVSGLPLGNTELLHPAVMVNLLGTGATGPIVVEGMNEALEIQGCSVHLYGKGESRANRKMGHATVIGIGSGATTADLREKAQAVREQIIITGK